MNCIQVDPSIRREVSADYQTGEIIQELKIRFISPIVALKNCNVNCRCKGESPGKKFPILLQSVVQVLVNGRQHLISFLETQRNLTAARDLDTTERDVVVLVVHRTIFGAGELVSEAYHVRDVEYPDFLFFFPPLPSPQHGRYVRHVCLRNIFFSEDPLYEPSSPTARGQSFLARKQD